MKRITFAAILTVAVLSLAILAGCGAKSGSAGAPAGVEQPSAAEQPSAPEQPSAAEQSSAAEQPSAPEQPSAAEDGSISVRSVLELTEAIRPGAKLVIEPGRYNLTDFLGAFSDEQACSAWNESHQYVQIIPVYDGVELEIRDVSGLSIRGGSERTSGTELVVEPRNAAVLHFLDCSDISLEGITMGHTETGACNGNVLDFMGCSRVSLRAMDLYGCGVYGVCVSEGSTWLSVSDSVIRDCSAGPFMIVDAPEGEFRFTDCSFTGSAEGGYYGFWGTSSLTFLRCAFGKEETDRWRWDDTAVFEDCIWTESPAVGSPFTDRIPASIQNRAASPLIVRAGGAIMLSICRRFSHSSRQQAAMCTRSVGRRSPVSFYQTSTRSAGARYIPSPGWISYAS